jgi:HK97 family phage portal protein
MDDLISKVGRVITNRVPSSPPAYPTNSTLPIGGSTRTTLFNSNDGALPLGEAAYEAYGSVGTLFAIVNQLANAFATVDWHLYRRTSLRDKKRKQEVLGHAFMTIWDMPNPFMTGQYFREACQQHLDLVGETIILIIAIGNIVIEMWPIRPDRIKPVKHPTKFLTGWIYTAPDGEEVPLELDQILQIKYPNPSDSYRGLSPIAAMMPDIQAARYAAEWNKNFFINGAQPGGIISIDYRMTDTEWKAFMDRWRSQHQGVANAHRVALLERATWQDTKFSMEDMQFVELRNLPRELIREAYAFPKPMLGTVDDVNRANSNAAKEIMAEGHTKPRLGRWKDSVDAFLLPRFANGKTLELDPDDPTPVNHEDVDRERDSQAKSAATLAEAGWHPDDVLDAMGLPEMRWVGPPRVKPPENQEEQ